MTTNRIDHTGCNHEATPAARRVCRKAHRDGTAAIASTAAQLMEILEPEWILRGARRFGSSYTTPNVPAEYLESANLRAAAKALAGYFAPSGDDARDARRVYDGYIVTTSAHEIRRIVLRAHS